MYGDEKWKRIAEVSRVTHERHRQDGERQVDEIQARLQNKKAQKGNRR